MDDPHAEVEIKPQLKLRGSVAKDTPHHQTEPSYLTKRFSLSGSGLLTQCIWSDLVSTWEAVCWVDPCASPSKEGDLAPANMCPGDCLPCLLPAEVLHFASRSPLLSADGCS